MDGFRHVGLDSFASVGILSDDEPGVVQQTTPDKNRHRLLTHREFLAASSCLLATVFLTFAIFITSFLSQTNSTCLQMNYASPGQKTANTAALMYVAFVGNSFTFWNRMPALVGKLGAGNARIYACVGSNTTLKSITKMEKKEIRQDGRTSPPEYLDNVQQLLQEGASGWDAVVLQDHSRGPIEFREDSIAALRDLYVPMLKQLRCGNNNTNQTHCLRTVLLFTTWSYDDNTTRAHQLTKASGFYADARAEGLSDFAQKLSEGYSAYASVLQKELPDMKIILAPVGLAFEVVRTVNSTLWRNLFFRQDYMHPSPAGSFLIASVIYGTLQTALVGSGIYWLEELHGQGAMVAPWTKTAIDAGWAPNTEKELIGFGYEKREVPSVESQLLGAAAAAVAGVADAMI